jgi:hypothetical protein
VYILYSIVQFKSRTILLLYGMRSGTFEKVLGKVCSCRSDNHVEFVTVTYYENYDVMFVSPSGSAFTQ